MKLIAKKPCSFGGEKFYIGNEIPLEFVLDPKAQEQMGVLSIVNDDADAADEVFIEDVPETITVLVHAAEGDLPLNLTADGLQAFVDAVTTKAEEAEKIVAQMNDGDALILLDIVDSRKTIKAAAKARALQINEESEGEQ